MRRPQCSEKPCGLYDLLTVKVPGLFAPCPWPAGPEGNVRLRLVPDKAWRFPEGAPIAPVAAVALDLAEDPDPRSSRAGRAALHDLDRDDVV